MKAHRPRTAMRAPLASWVPTVMVAVGLLLGAAPLRTLRRGSRARRIPDLDHSVRRNTRPCMFPALPRRLGVRSESGNDMKAWAGSVVPSVTSPPLTSCLSKVIHEEDVEDIPHLLVEGHGLLRGKQYSRHSPRCR